MVTHDPSNLTIGLFGTCDRSTWRDAFMARYDELGISYYNPQLGPGEWDPETSPVIEAEHLATDPVIVFAVTWESASVGSLGETGWSVLGVVSQAMHTERDVVIYISTYVDGTMVDNPALADASVRARRLVIEHLKKFRHIPNIWVVRTLEDALDLSIRLRSTHVERNLLRNDSRYNIE